MTRSTYDRSVRALMQTFADGLAVGETFAASDVLTWFQARYPRVGRRTVRAMLESATANAPARASYPEVKPGTAYDLFWRGDFGRYRRFDPARDPPPVYWGDPATLAAEPASAANVSTEDGAPTLQGALFAMPERPLRDWLADHLDAIEPGLRLEGEASQGRAAGVEYPTATGPIDILARDLGGGYIVIEVKRGPAGDSAVGQILRYMNWIEAERAHGAPVRGILIAGAVGHGVKIACRNTNVRLLVLDLALALRAA